METEIGSSVNMLDNAVCIALTNPEREAKRARQVLRTITEYHEQTCSMAIDRLYMKLGSFEKKQIIKTRDGQRLIDICFDEWSTRFWCSIEKGNNKDDVLCSWIIRPDITPLYLTINISQVNQTKELCHYMIMLTWDPTSETPIADYIKSSVQSTIESV